MKNELLSLLTRESITQLFRPFQHGAVTIFMLHRFADLEYGNRGHSIDVLRANLGFLRRHHFRLMGLPELVGELDEGRLGSEPGVVFTVDDGYGDFARLAAPVFAEFDCPVTVFITTGFVDGGFWMWWDKIIWALSKSKRKTVDLQVGPDLYRYSLESGEARWRASADLIERVKRYPDAVMQVAIDDLLQLAEVELPRQVPRMFLPMTWDEISRCAKQGVTFGPHTVTHPLLSRVDDARSLTELQGSWRRLRAATSAAIPVFCFPNGDHASFTDRERRTIKAMGMRAFVTAEQHFTTSAYARVDRADVTVELPRYGYPDDSAQFRQIVTGIERLKRSVRRFVHASRTSVPPFDPSSFSAASAR